jgi:hypothetical protein
LAVSETSNRRRSCLLSVRRTGGHGPVVVAGAHQAGTSRRRCGASAACRMPSRSRWRT